MWKRARLTLPFSSNWTVTPQVYVDGEFIGGSDIVLEMFESGELQKKLQSSATS